MMQAMEYSATFLVRISDVFFARTIPRFEHRKAARHEHHQHPHQQEVEGVQRVIGLNEIFHESSP